METPRKENIENVDLRSNVIANVKAINTHTLSTPQTSRTEDPSTTHNSFSFRSLWFGTPTEEVRPVNQKQEKPTEPTLASPLLASKNEANNIPSNNRSDPLSSQTSFPFTGHTSYFPFGSPPPPVVPILFYQPEPPAVIYCRLLWMIASSCLWCITNRSHC